MPGAEAPAGWQRREKRLLDPSGSNVTPRIAYEKVNDFLAALGIASEPEQQEAERPDEGPE